MRVNSSASDNFSHLPTYMENDADMNDGREELSYFELPSDVEARIEKFCKDDSYEREIANLVDLAISTGEWPRDNVKRCVAVAMMKSIRIYEAAEEILLSNDADDDRRLGRMETLSRRLGLSFEEMVSEALQQPPPTKE
jgi:hypothetical protein